MVAHAYNTSIWEAEDHCEFQVSLEYTVRCSQILFQRGGREEGREMEVSLAYT